MRVCTQVWVKSGVTFLHEQNSFMLTHPRVCWQLSTHRTREVKLICNIPSFKRNRHQVTRKCGNCERIATWGGLLDAAPVFVRFNYDAHTKVEVDQPIRPLLPYSVLTVMHYVTLWPWPLIYDLEHFVCGVIKLDLYLILAKSSNPLFDLMTLNMFHVLRYVFSQSLNSVNLFMDNGIFYTLCYVMMWPWPLALQPWTSVMHQVSRDQSLYEIWAKSSNSRLSYW